jgi:hypothetical protein
VRRGGQGRSWRGCGEGANTCYNVLLYEKFYNFVDAAAPTADYVAPPLAVVKAPSQPQAVGGVGGAGHEKITRTE